MNNKKDITHATTRRRNERLINNSFVLVLRRIVASLRETGFIMFWLVRLRQSVV